MDSPLTAVRHGWSRKRAPDSAFALKREWVYSLDVIRFPFNVEKSAQAGAFLLKMNGGEFDTYKFIKFLYLADREALRCWNEPITGDHAASMPYGPVLSTIYDLTKGTAPYFHDVWSQFISDTEKETHLIFLTADPGTRLLSRSEMRILKEVFDHFKSYGWRQLRDYTHGLQEYDKDVGDGSSHIPVERILTALDKSEKEVVRAQKELQDFRRLDALFSD